MYKHYVHHTIYVALRILASNPLEFGLIFLLTWPLHKQLASQWISATRTHHVLDLQVFDAGTRPTGRRLISRMARKAFLFIRHFLHYIRSPPGRGAAFLWFCIKPDKKAWPRSDWPIQSRTLGNPSFAYQSQISATVYEDPSCFLHESHYVPELNTLLNRK